MRKIIKFILPLLVLCMYPYNSALAQEESKNTLGYSIDINELDIIKKDLIVDITITPEEEVRLAKTLYGEDNKNSILEKSAVIWCILNRLDTQIWGDDIQEVVTHGQFHGYFNSQKHPQWAHELVRDVVLRYALEKMGYVDVGRTLPPDYLYFNGVKGHNVFRKEYVSKSYWDWTLINPYEEEE